LELNATGSGEVRLGTIADSIVVEAAADSSTGVGSAGISTAGRVGIAAAGLAEGSDGTPDVNATGGGVELPDK
jgi:hypothetical protein